MKPNEKSQPETLKVFLPLQTHLRGGRKTVISPVRALEKIEEKRPYDNAIIKALARAFLWRRKIEQGEFNSITELAKAEGVNQSYACRLLRLTLLSPEIVQVILDPHLEQSLQLKDLMRPFPPVWEAQRSVLDDNRPI